MNFDWNIIGENVSLFYEVMEYQSDYSTIQFFNDYKTELIKKVEIPNELLEFKGDFLRIQLLKNLLYKHRSILTKLFSLTNNSNGVDMLIEYCDYYLSDCFNSKKENICDRTIDELLLTFGYIFMRMAENRITDRVSLDIWKIFLKNIGWSSEDGDKHWTLPFLNLISRSTLAMVIMADSDLNAAVQAFIGSYNTFYQVTEVLVQEPIKKQLLNRIRNEEFKDNILSILFVFRNTEEAIGRLNGKDIEALSIWSENVIAAKKFSANAQINTIWINALGLFDFGLHSMPYFPGIFNSHYGNPYLLALSDEFSKTDIKKAKKYDHFYGGKWQSPVNGKYWTNQSGDSIAESTSQDFENCNIAAREAFKVWRSTKLSQRVKVIRCFAERLRANGESEYAGIVLKLLERPLDFGTLLSIVRDGEAEILTTPEPVGVIGIPLNDEKKLFSQLTIASVTGNAVIVVLNREFYVSFAPYCDLLGTCGFPQGLISCMFTTNDFLNGIKSSPKYFNKTLLDPVAFPNKKIHDPYKHKTTENTQYDNTFIYVTKPKSVWIAIR